MKDRIKNAKKWRGDSSNHTEFKYKRYKREEKQSSSFDLKGLLKNILTVATFVVSVLGLISKAKKAYA
jgi:hypothetical protein